MISRNTHPTGHLAVSALLTLFTTTILAAWGPIVPVHADLMIWDPEPPSDGDWHNSDNWSGLGFPSIDDDVQILIADEVRLTADSTLGPSDDGIDSLVLEGGAELSTNGHRLNTFFEDGGVLGTGDREDFTTIHGAGSKLRVSAGGSPNDFETFQLTLENGGELLLEGGTALVGKTLGGESGSLAIDSTSAILGQGTLTANANVANSGTVNVDGQTTVEGDLANSGVFHVIGQGDVEGALDNQIDGVLIIDNAKVCCDATLTLHSSLVSENHGLVELTSQVEQDSELATPLFINGESGTLRLSGPDDLDGDGTIAGERIIGGNVSNFGAMEIQANAQIEGSLGTAVNAETIIDGADSCCHIVVDVEEGINNSGRLDVTTQAKGATLQLGAGEQLVNNAAGVVNLQEETSADALPTHAIVGDVANSGQFNIRTNAQIEGSLQIAFDAETIIDGADSCCHIVVDAAEGVANHGTMTLAGAAADDATVGVTADHSFVNETSGRLTGVGTIAGDLVNSGTIEPGSSTGRLAVAGDYTQDEQGLLMIEASGLSAGADYDQLVVDGGVTLDGAVQLSLLEGFTPAVGDQFDIIAGASSVEGGFSDFFLPGLPEGMQWSILSAGGNVSLATTITGDFNADGQVRGDDFLIWQRGETVNALSASDLADWESNFGSSAAAADRALIYVPEPSSAWLLILGVVALATQREQVTTALRQGPLLDVA